MARRTEAYVKRLPEYEKEATGLTFINEVDIVVATLGKRYEGHLRIDKKHSGYEKDVSRNNQKSHNDKIAFETFVIGLEAWAPKSMAVAHT